MNADSVAAAELQSPSFFFILGTPDVADVCERICSCSGGTIVPGKIEIGKFKDGETHIKLDRREISRQHVIVVGNFNTAEGVLIARDTAFCARNQGATEITVFGICSNYLERAITVPAFLDSDFSKRMEVLDHVFDDLRDSTQLLLVDTNPNSKIKGMLYHFDRVMDSRKAIGTTVNYLLASLRTLYGTSAIKQQYYKGKPLPVFPRNTAYCPAVIGMPGHEKLADAVANSINSVVYTADQTAIGFQFSRLDYGGSFQGEDVIIIGGTQTEQATLDLFCMAWYLAEKGAHSITIYCPYFAYSTMERGKHGECVTAKSRAELLSTMPKLPGGVRIVLCDLHSEGIPHYFREADVRVDHMYLEPLVLEALRRIKESKKTGLLSGHMPKYVVSSVDGGRLKWVQTFADILMWFVVTVLKRRVGDGQVEKAGFVGGEHIRGSHVVIYDDMIRTGGSLAEAIAQIAELKPQSISVVCSHGVLPGGALQRLKDTGLCGIVQTFDTHPRAVELSSQSENNGFLVVDSIAPLIVNDIRDCGLVIAA